MKEITIPFVDVEVSFTNPEPGAREILKSMRPDWPLNNVQIQDMSGGNVNVMLCCHLTSDEEKYDALIVRIHGPHHGDFFQRKNEIAAMVMANDIGCSQPVLATFKNGFVARYARGDNLAYNEIFDSKIARLATRTLAKIKTINVKDYKISDTKGNVYTVPGENMLCRLLRENLNKIPEENFRAHPGIPRREEALFELDRLEAYLNSLNIPITCCHNDFHIRNVIYERSTGAINLVDFDCMAMGYEHVDLCFMLFDSELFTTVAWCTVADGVVDDKTQLMWIRCYLEAKAELAGGKPGDVTQEEVTSFHRIFKKCMPLWSLRMLVCCCMFISGNLSTDGSPWPYTTVLMWKKYLEQTKGMFVK